MARINARAVYDGPRTHEGGMAKRINAVEQLERSVMSCLLWEDSFYENGETVAERIAALTVSVPDVDARRIMFAAKQESKLRHAPLWMAVAMAKMGHLRAADLDTLITRADDLTEFLALYWKNGKTPLAGQVKKGLALAFHKFDEYHLAKYNRKNAIKLRDVLRLVHPRPDTEEQADLWRRLLEGSLIIPDTWETALSSGADKNETFTRLLQEKTLGDLAFLRNLRNMDQVGVDPVLIKESFKSREWKFILPFQFVTAARIVPRYEPQLEAAMFKCLEQTPKSDKSVTVLVDASGSMRTVLSAKSEQRRSEVAAGLAILAREQFSDIDIGEFDGEFREVPARRGFALRDALHEDGGSTRMWNAIMAAGKKYGHKSLMIVLTDEQTQDDGVPSMANADLLVIVNVSDNQNGVQYEKGVLHINGWSENVVKYILKYVESIKEE